MRFLVAQVNFWPLQPRDYGRELFNVLEDRHAMPGKWRAMVIEDSERYAKALPSCHGSRLLIA